jgi:uncharacterized membrane protein
VSAVVEKQGLGPKHEPWSVRAIIAADRGIYRVARRWLLVANLLALPFALLPLLAPLFRAGGWEALARPAYGLFATVCHQKDNRSFHVYGEKMACCHRCFGVYGGLFLFGLIYAILRSRAQSISPLKPVWLVLLAGPLVVDGLLSTAGVWESTWYLRLATGLLFAAAVTWTLLPYLEGGFAQIRHDLERRFTRLVAQGRARPLRGAPSPISTDTI